MKRPNRRSFIGSAVATAGLGLSAGRQALAQTAGGSFTKQYNFSIQHDILGRTSADGSLLTANPWAISDKDAELVPYLKGELAVPLVPQGESAQCLSCATGESIPEFLPIPQRFVDFRLLGDLPTAELIGDIVQARSQDQYLDLSFIVMDGTGGVKINAPELVQSFSLTEPRIISPLAYIRYWEAYGYRLQFRGPDYVGLIPCAPDAPKHYHIELSKQNIRGGWDYKMNLHIAIWKASPGRYCFAVANSEGWPQCIKICNPTWNDIYQPILSALLAIGIAYLVAVVLASLVATFIYGSLAVLAV